MKQGKRTGIDWFKLTSDQLIKWECKYHNLIVGKKPDYDLLICDKAISAEEYFKR